MHRYLFIKCIKIANTQKETLLTYCKILHCALIKDDNRYTQMEKEANEKDDEAEEIAM